MLGVQGPRHYRKVGEMNGNKASDFQPDSIVYSKAEMRMLLDEKADLIIKAHGFKDQRDELLEALDRLLSAIHSNKDELPIDVLIVAMKASAIVERLKK